MLTFACVHAYYVCVQVCVCMYMCKPVCEKHVYQLMSMIPRCLGISSKHLTCGAWCVDVGHGDITSHPLPHAAVWLHRKSSHHQQVKVLHACRNLAGREPLHIHRQSLQIFKNATDCNKEIFTCTTSCFRLLLIYDTSCLRTKQQQKSSTSVYVCVCVCVCVHFTNVGLDIQ